LKTCSILIPNYNSGDAIALAVESIRAHDAGYPYRIIVHDDYPANGIDAPYLADALKRGLIDELYTDADAQGHGGSLNILLNEKCQSDFAAVLDCDTVIRRGGWLRSMIDAAEADPKVALVSDFKPGGYQFLVGGYRTGFYLLWFSLFNMTAYRDGLQTDFRFSLEDRRNLPYADLFAPYYPPESNTQFMAWWNEKDGKGGRRHFTACPSLAEFPHNQVMNDPGAQFYVKLLMDNPRGYKAVNLPPTVNGAWYHFGHISMLGATPKSNDTPDVVQARTIRLGQIRAELKRIREGK
jgi:glycosyltransferase involved in cell wall biosynthesis